MYCSKDSSATRELGQFSCHLVINCLYMYRIQTKCYKMCVLFSKDSSATKEPGQFSCHLVINCLYLYQIQTKCCKTHVRIAFKRLKYYKRARAVLLSSGNQLCSYVSNSLHVLPKMIISHISTRKGCMENCFHQYC